MHELIAPVDAHATDAEASGRIDQPSHQEPVGLEEMGAIGWIPARQGLVGGADAVMAATSLSKAGVRVSGGA